MVVKGKSNDQRERREKKEEEKDSFYQSSYWGPQMCCGSFSFLGHSLWDWQSPELKLRKGISGGEER